MSLSFLEIRMFHYSKKNVCWWVIINFSDVPWAQRLTDLIRAWGSQSRLGPDFTQFIKNFLRKFFTVCIGPCQARRKSEKPTKLMFLCLWIWQKWQPSHSSSPLLLQSIKWISALKDLLLLLHDSLLLWPLWWKYECLLCLVVRDVVLQVIDVLANSSGHPGPGSRHLSLDSSDRVAERGPISIWTLHIFVQPNLTLGWVSVCFDEQKVSTPISYFNPILELCNLLDCSLTLLASPLTAEN